MKKKIVFIYATAMALLGTSFQACSSDDDADDTPVVTGEIVKTRLALSVPLGSTANARTRMSADATQADEQFNGMNTFVIYPMSVSGGRITSGDQTFLGVKVTGDITASEIGIANDKWVNADVPVGVNNMLFYGLAASVATTESAFVDGSLKTKAFDKDNAIVTSSTSKVGDVEFELEQIAPQLTIENLGATTFTSGEGARSLLALLNGVLQAKLADDGTTWYSVATGTDTSYPNYNQLKDYFDKFKTLSTASSESIRLMLEDFYNTLSVVASSDMCTAIKDAITATTYGKAQLVASGTEIPYTLSWADGKDPNFPVSFNIPAGGVALSYADTDGTPAFSFANQTTDGLQISALGSYVYPAALYYFANSPILTSSSKESDKLPTTSTDDAATIWTNFLGNYSPAATSVTATTQSVAVVDQIQYGVGNLKTTVKISANTLKDYENNDINVAASPLTWTGVLVGGQKNVDWKFEPITASGEYTIFDHDMKGTAEVTTTASTTPNYTLVLQTKEYANENDIVTIALEFKNTCGHAFNGAGGQLIPAGGTFYLLARLNPTATSGVEKPVGDTTLGNRVFMQDYTTEVALTITSLKNAYNVVPDLRTPRLELGMSVDLRWQTGIKFTQNIGGDD